MVGQSIFEILLSRPSNVKQEDKKYIKNSERQSNKTGT